MGGGARQARTGDPIRTEGNLRSWKIRRDLQAAREGKLESRDRRDEEYGRSSSRPQPAAPKNNRADR